MSSIVSTLRIRNLVLHREADDVEFGQRREGLERIRRDPPAPHQLLHVDPGRKSALAKPILTVVHQRVENLQAVMAHADLVRVGECHAQFAADRIVVLDHGVQLAARVLRWALHSVARRMRTISCLMR